MKTALISIALALSAITVFAQSDSTYAEKLGWKKNDKVVIFHVDDAGMSFESNQGAKASLDYGIATSVSIMMPCPWSADMIKYLINHPEIDAGLHLTHTSEWEAYRWAPVSGTSVPGLLDLEGALWNNVPDVLKHATADEVFREIAAQVEKARMMGFSPTHLDTHMGVLWSSPQFLESYIAAGVKLHIPVLYAGGHGRLLMKQLGGSPLSGLSRLARIDTPDANKNDKILAAIQRKGREIWDRGLAVVDDLYVSSYDWKSDTLSYDYKTKMYEDLLNSLRPGITVIMVHSTDIRNSSFQQISDSGRTRFADLLSMINSDLKKFIEDKGIILTTWRELQKRRDRIK